MLTFYYRIPKVPCLTVRGCSVQYLAVLLILISFVRPGFAASAQEESPWTLGLAAGSGQRNNPLVDSDDIDINLVVDFAWYGERFFFDNGDLGFNLTESNRFSLSAIGTFNNERNYYSYLTGKNLGLDLVASAIRPDRLDEADLVGPETLPGERPETPPTESILFEQTDSSLAERDFAFNAGLELLYLTTFGDFQAQLLTDASSTHNGQEAWMSYSYPWFLPDSRIELTLGMEWKSADLADYYYGVRAEESSLARPEYHPGGGVNSFVRLSASHRFNAHWSLVSVLEKEQLSSNIRNSPIVERDSIDTFFIGLYYRF